MLYIFFDIERTRRRSISLYDSSLSIDEEFREVPLDSISEESSFLRLQMLVEWVRLCAIHRYLR